SRGSCNRRLSRRASDAPSSPCRSWGCRKPLCSWTVLAAESMDAWMLAGEQRVFLVELAAAARLRRAVFGDAAPGERGVLVLPLGQSDDLAVIGNIRLEGEEAGLAPRHVLHQRRFGAVNRVIDIGTLAVAENDQEHSAASIQV